MPVKLGAAASGAVTTATGVATEAITAGDPVFVRAADGKLFKAEATGDGDGAKTADHPSRDDYAGTQMKENQIFIDRASGRALWMSNEGGYQYKYSPMAKLLRCDTTTGQVTSAGGHPGDPHWQYWDTLAGGRYFTGCVWSQTQKSWIYVSREDNTGGGANNYELHFGRLRFATDSQRQHTDHYTFNAGNSGEFQHYSSNYGANGLVIDNNDNVYFYSSHQNSPSSCQLHYIDWSADAAITASDIKNRVQAPSAYNANIYTKSIRGCFDSANDQVILVTSATPYGGLYLFAFDVTAAGGISYSHGLNNANGNSGVGYGAWEFGGTETIWDIECDNSGNFCIMRGDDKIYYGKNSGTAFTPTLTPIDAPSGLSSGMPLAMRYFPDYDQWVAVYAETDGTYTSATTVKMFQISDGVLGSKTVTRGGLGQWATSQMTYGGPLVKSYIHNYGGLRGALTDNGRFFGYGEGADFYIWGGNVSGSWLWSNSIAISKASMGNYLGIASADIASGASGDVTTAGGEKDGFTNLIPGASYSVIDSTGAMVVSSALTDAQKTGAHFAGTATSTTTLLIGKNILSPTAAVPEAVLPPASKILQGRFCRTADNHTNCKYVCNALEYSYTVSGLKTAVDVTGTGIWTCGIFVSNSLWTSARVKVTIDDVIVLDGTESIGNWDRGMAQCGALTNAPNSTGGLSFTEGHIPFNSSLKVEVEASHTAYYLYNYTLT
jgi:hypothetical protein